MAKKSNAQIRRMQRRAAARGEEYIPPIVVTEATTTTTTTKQKEEEENPKKQRMLAAAETLAKELRVISQNEEMRSKERRSAKRKAEAVAVESSGCATLAELNEWYQQHQKSVENRPTKKQKNNNKEELVHRTNPYIVFVGQLSYGTTREGLFRHVQDHLGAEHTVTEETVRVRLLSDAKTKKSRGMAFVETTDPELLYAFLKLHHTSLDGRRINVERSAGGKKQSTARQSKLQQYRRDQADYMAQTVTQLLSQHVETGELRDDELDEGVRGLCQRHSPATVENALIRYIETNGRDMDNPSAYFTHLIGKIATEGVFGSSDDGNKHNNNRSSNNNRGNDKKREKRQQQQQQQGNESTTLSNKNGLVGNKLQETSGLARDGVDMSVSEPTQGDLSRIFPSMANRGRRRA